MEYKIDVAKEFSEFPFGRYSPDDGDFSGQVFRETILKGILEKVTESDVINVDFDGVLIGVGSSFLDESFGGAVRNGYIEKNKLLKTLKITCQDSLYDSEIRGYIHDAKPSPEIVSRN